jgi:hypothetical protein
MDEVYIARNTYPLVFSSTFFLLPCAISIPNQMHSYTALLLLTFAISANYWRKATYGFRRNTDLVFSKLIFTIFFIKGFYTVVYVPKDTPLKYLRLYAGFASLFSIIYFYYMSERTYHRGHPNWIYFHMIFHMFVGIEQGIIIKD